MKGSYLRSALASVCVVWIAALPISAKDACVPSDDLSLFVCRYGEPDTDKSTENDRPRPPIVTRAITYTKERVRVTYVPDAKVGDPPPYKKWKLTAFQDAKTDATISPQEAVKRLQARDSKR